MIDNGRKTLKFFPMFVTLESNSKPEDGKDDFSLESVKSEFLWIIQIQRKVQMGKTS